MFKKRITLRSIICLFLILMMAIPQAAIVHAEEETGYEETTVEEVLEEEDEDLSEEAYFEEDSFEEESEPVEEYEEPETEEEELPEEAEIFITLSASELELRIGESFVLEALISGIEEETEILWTVEDPDVVSVDNGTVTALKAGGTSVRASILDGTVFADAFVKVVDTDEAQIEFEENSYEVAIGETIVVPYKLKEGSFEDIEWTLSDDQIVEINTDEEGMVTIKGIQSGAILVSAAINGVTNSIGVVVLSEEDGEFDEARAVGESKASTIVTGTFSLNFKQSSARELATLLSDYRWNTAQISNLIYDYTIEKYAMQRVAEIVINFDHVRPNGSQWHTVFDKSIYGQESTTNLKENILCTGDGSMATASQVLNRVLSNNDQRTRSLRASTRSIGVAHAVYNGIDYWVMLFSDTPAVNISPTSAINSAKDVSVKIASSYYSSPSFTASKTLLKVNVGKTISLPTITGKVNVVLGGQKKAIAFTGYSVSWALDTAGKKYASITSDGRIKAGNTPNNSETAYLIATIKMNSTQYTVKVQLKVMQPVTGVTVSPTSAQIDVGKTVKLTANVKPDNASDKSVTWKSSNTSIATVSSSGVVTGKKGGTCKITVTTNDGGYKASASIEVIVHATGIAFEIGELTMTVGMEEKLTPVFTPKETTDKRVTYKVSDTSKVSIASDGTLRALKATGDTPVIVTMTSVDRPALSAELPVTIKDLDQVKKVHATYLWEHNYEINLYEYEGSGDDFVNTMYKGDLIRLYCDTTGATIYYTTDGSTPTTSSKRYADAIVYEGGSFTLKAIAVKPERMKDSEVVEFKIGEDEEYYWEILEEDLEKLKGDDGIYHIPNGLWAAGVDESAVYTGGKITFPNMRVYYRKHMLMMNTDYKVSYKNNTNVCPEEQKACTITYKDDGSYKPASNTKVSYITITGKGNYKGSTYVPFRIQPVAITEDNGFSYQNELYVALSTKALKPVPVILWNGKKLKNNTDFVVAYSRNAEGTEILENGITEAGDYYAIITGIKNYTVSDKRIAVPIHVKAGTLLSKTTMKIENVIYSGETVDLDTLNITVKNGKTTLEKGVDYVIEKVLPENPKDIGTYTVTIKATDASNYVGEKSASFKITGKPLSKAKVYCLGTTVTYTGNTFTLKELYKVNAKRPDLNEVTLYYGDEKLVENKDYTVQISGQNKGKGKVTFIGIGDYTGKITKEFTINAKTLTKDDLIIYIIDMYFTKNGARPYVYVILKTVPDDPSGYEISDGVYGRVMEEGAEYTLKYFNNKKVYTDDTYKTKNPPSVSVVMKGNYKGTIANNYFLIMSEDISWMDITAADAIYSSSKKGKQYYVTPVVYDYQGKKLTVNKDFQVTYYYAQDAKVNGSATYNRAYGTPIRATDIPEPGTVIGVEVTGMGSYYGSLYTEYKVIRKATSLSNSTVTMNYQNGKNKYFEYTGSQIVPTAENIKVTLNKKVLTFGVDYEIQSITNNVKAGKATMVLHGIGDYGGTKKVTFSIGKQSLILDLGNLIRSLFGL